MDTAMNTTTDDRAMLPGLRLLQLVSPSLPVGGFTYSQGLEWAVECGWVTDAESLKAWIENLLETSIASMETPILIRLYLASARKDIEALSYWSHYLLASRETRELRQEERNRGRAMASLLPEVGVPITGEQLPSLKQCQLACFAHAARYWQIPLREASAAYLWGWLENITLAGVKIIPLGQTQGQMIIAELTSAIPQIVTAALELPDERIGASCTAQAIASSQHETQYTRIYRS
jgi:urease accessory protein